MLRKLSSLLCIFALLASIGLGASRSARAGVGIPAEPAKIPEWALAVLSLREFGAFFDKAAAYAGRVLPNSAALAKQSLQSFFKFPVRDGLKRDEPGLIYILDPQAAGVQKEAAFFLPLADAAAFKLALVNALGMPVEANGVLTFTLPQPLPEPDKQLLVQLTGDKAWIAPTPETLKKLIDFTGNTTAYDLMGHAASDAVLTLKLERIKRLYGTKLNASLELGVMMATMDVPQQAEGLKKRAAEALSLLWQVDLAELHLAFDEIAGASAELKVRPVKDSALASEFKKLNGLNVGRLVRFLPLDAPLIATWNMSGAALASGVRAEWAKQTVNASPDNPLPQAGKEISLALADLIEQLNGEASVALWAKDQGLGLLFGAESADTAKALAAVKTAVERTVAAANAGFRTYTANPNLPNVVVLKAGPGGTQNTVTIHECQIEVPSASAQERAPVERLLGWPAAVDLAQSGKALLVCSGRNAQDTLKQALNRDSQGKQALPSMLTAGTAALVLIRPVQLAGDLLRIDPDQTASAEKLVAGLPRTPILITVPVGDGSLALRVQVPAETANALLQLRDRMKRARVAFGSSGTVPDAAIPAPPPAK